MTANKCNNKGKKTISMVALFGVLIVLTGFVLLSFNVGWLNPACKPIVFSWPMLLILLAVIGYVKRQIMFPTILLLFGVFFLLPRIENVYPGLLGIAGKDFTSQFWPFLLIVAGLMIIIGVVINRKKNRISLKRHIVDNHGNATKTGGWIAKDIVFGGSTESIFTEPVLNGGDIDIVFGGLVIDLRKTTLPDTTVYLDIDIVFGGITLYVPEDWCVQSNLDSVFGGYSDKRMNTSVVECESNSKLVLRGSLVFSGCTIQ
ncbi:MAG TPA: LiaF-related protein [Bacteroidales bacterium]|nr:LiaF-related protein [Bacteroidales bacterium]HOR60600.1 LiaF-related protein [Bacteroidales bacterium]HPL04823.1 LiaF-related protein [Bacteroidales bacterium]